VTRSIVETLLLSVKYAGMLLTAAYGIYATVTDFKVEKNGKKILSIANERGLRQRSAVRVVVLGVSKLPGEEPGSTIERHVSPNGPDRSKTLLALS
jgi:hypothetical protein